MRECAGGAQSAATRAGILGAPHDLGRVADERPAAGNFVEKFDAILEARAIDEPDRRLARREALQRGDQGSRVKSGLGIAGAAGRGRERPGIHVVEEIGDEGPKSGPPRGGGERAPRGGGDQDCAAP